MLRPPYPLFPLSTKPILARRASRADNLSSSLTEIGQQLGAELPDAISYAQTPNSTFAAHAPGGLRSSESVALERENRLAKQFSSPLHATAARALSPSSYS
eukprot:2964656-Pleurochrysis_carterae.AAC.1